MVNIDSTSLRRSDTRWEAQSRAHLLLQDTHAHLKKIEDAFLLRLSLFLHPLFGESQGGHHHDSSNHDEDY